MEAQQCVKLTGTNSSIGLIILITCAHRDSDGWFVLTDERGFAAILRTGRRIGADGQSALRASPGRPGLRKPGGKDEGHGKEQPGRGLLLLPCCPIPLLPYSPTNQLLENSFSVRFVDLVVMAGRLHPFPFRTRP